jgi:hypothetical protein
LSEEDKVKFREFCMGQGVTPSKILRDFILGILRQADPSRESGDSKDPTVKIENLSVGQDLAGSGTEFWLLEIEAQVKKAEVFLSAKGWIPEAKVAEIRKLARGRRLPQDLIARIQGLLEAENLPKEGINKVSIPQRPEGVR